MRMRTKAMNLGLKTYSYQLWNIVYSIDYILWIIYNRLRTIDIELSTENYELWTKDLRL